MSESEIKYAIQIPFGENGFLYVSDINTGEVVLHDTLCEAIKQARIWTSSKIVQYEKEKEE